MSTDAKPTQTKPPRPRGGKLFAFFLFLILGGATGAAGYYFWQQQQGDRAATTDADSRLRAELREAVSHMQAQNQILQEQVGALTQTLKSLQGEDHNDWLVAEAEYLVRIAIHRLALERDVYGAATALRTADQLLNRTGDPSWIPVRQAIAKDITNLEAVKVPDVAGLSAELSSLMGLVDGLPMVAPQRQPAADQQQATAEGEGREEPGAWENLWNRMGEAFDELVVIRDTEGPVAPLMSPDELYFLKQNLRLQLESARFALLRGEASAYRDSLQQAYDWLGQYFNVNRDDVILVRKRIQALQAHNIAPAMPDVSATLRLLHQAQRQQRRLIVGEGQ